MAKINFLAQWKQRVKKLNSEIRALIVAYTDPRVPWYARLFMAAVIGYAISPIDLIPDFIPVLGYLDDLIILPLGIYLAIRMIPQDIMNECRAKAVTHPFSKRTKWLIAGIIISLWIVIIFLTVKFIWQAFL